jgi:hypothetical protein
VSGDLRPPTTSNPTIRLEAAGSPGNAGVHVPHACAYQADLPALAEGAYKQQRLLVGSPRDVGLDDLELVLRESL